jgi:hypothetical protein
MKKIVLFIFIISSLQFSYGQDIEEYENWLGKEGYPYPELRHDYKNYSKEDVAKAKQRLSLIGESEAIDEFEGYYQQYGELSQIGLIWNSKAGFIDYYIYTCSIELRGLGFGDVQNSADLLSLNYEKPRYKSSQKKENARLIQTLVKVKIGNRRF